ncbi:transcriptional regulator [Streptomyces cinereoruber]|uniref:transcriptional regulator n=1 Tax=Streptomyces cinereoruber TaxID=67260 RepID=UPI003628AB1F
MSHALDTKAKNALADRSTAVRLADRLAALLPGVAVVHVRLQDPRTLWPHIRLTAVDERQQVVPVPRAKALTVARWIIRTFPQAQWSSSRGTTFDLRTAQLAGQDA